jgi:arylsulfatase A-like enzyme
MKHLFSVIFFLTTISVLADKPNVVLIMTDDQGWGQTGYYNHPVLKTPNLDAMAKNGLRFDRFYAGAPVCSPTRASVLTGRCNDRTGVPSHGHSLRRQEKTISAALKAAGYATGHFGKWHLNGLRGPGVPVLKDDPNSPGVFGFDEWLTVTNFFESNPLMGHKGDFEAFEGDCSDGIVREALKFIGKQAEAKKPFLTVIWDGSPHAPFVASDEDIASFKDLSDKDAKHYGELVAFDRSVGTLRKGLRDLGVADNTIVWFCSDNGGLPGIKPPSVGGLRGNKGNVYEGGLRVPGIVEWPAGIKPRITSYPAATMDIFPTIADILNLPDDVLLKPVDGISLKPLFAGEIGPRKTPIPFRFGASGALVDNDHKLVKGKKGEYELYNLVEDKTESKNLAAANPELATKMIKTWEAWNATVDASVAGKDYPEGKVLPGNTPSHFWVEDERYKPFFPEFVKRPEYKSWIEKRTKGAKKPKKNKKK